MGYQSLARNDPGDAREGTQRRILVETTLANEKKSVGIAYLLWFFFGSLGGHNFYVGKIHYGLMQVTAYVIGLGAFFSGYFPITFLFAGGLILSLIVDLCLIPSRVAAHTEQLRQRLSDGMTWEY